MAWDTAGGRRAEQLQCGAGVGGPASRGCAGFAGQAANEEGRSTARLIGGSVVTSSDHRLLLSSMTADVDGL